VVQGHELALGMGLQLAIARLARPALSTSVPIAKAFGTVSAPLVICLVMLCIGVLAFFVYTLSDKKLDASVAEDRGTAKSEREEFHLKDIGIIITTAVWYLAILWPSSIRRCSRSSNTRPAS